MKLKTKIVLIEVCACIFAIGFILFGARLVIAGKISLNVDLAVSGLLLYQLYSCLFMPFGITITEENETN